MRRIVQGMHLDPATGKLTPQGAKRLFAVLTQAMAEDEIPADHPEIVAICCEELEQVVMQFCQHVSDIEVNRAYETLFPDAVETDAAAVQIQGVLRGAEVRKQLAEEAEVMESCRRDRLKEGSLLKVRRWSQRQRRADPSVSAGSSPSSSPTPSSAEDETPEEVRWSNLLEEATVVLDALNGPEPQSGSSRSNPPWMALVGRVGGTRRML